jgi:ABC-2 type transport system ATP-binding protein
MLKVTNLTKSYGAIKALDSITFTVKEGEITGFLGPNGAGKTTTLRIITNYLSPDKGNISFDKKDVNLHFKEVITDVGYLPEDNPLYKNMRVDEYLMFNAKIKSADDKKELKDIAKKCGIDEVLTKEIEKLSKGYKQRVGLAKALIGNPKVLILDEPTAGLDPNQKEAILALIKSYAKGRTILFSSHVLSEVTQIADKVIIINKGKIVAEGNKEQLVKKYLKNATIQISTNAPKSQLARELGKIRTIGNVERTSRAGKEFQDFEINCTDAEKTALELFNTVVANNWQLNQLHTKSQGLEELFKELTK